MEGRGLIEGGTYQFSFQRTFSSFTLIFNRKKQQHCPGKRTANTVFMVGNQGYPGHIIQFTRTRRCIGMKIVVEASKVKNYVKKR